MGARKRKIIHFLSSSAESLCILYDFNPENLEHNYFIIALELFVLVQFLFNFLWIQCKQDRERTWLFLVLGLSSLMLDLYSKTALNSKTSLKKKRFTICITRLINAILIKALFLIAFEKSLRGNTLTLISNLQTNYILTLLNLSFGYLSWAFMMLMFLSTYFIASGISLLNTDPFQDRNIFLILGGEEYHLSLISTNLLIFIIVIILIRKRAKSSETISKMMKDTPIGKVILRSESKEVLFANDTLLNILGIKKRSLTYDDLNACCFSRVLKLTQHPSLILPGLPSTEKESPLSAKSLHLTKLSLIQILDSLKYSPNEVFTAYTSIQIMSHQDQLPGWKLRSEKLNVEHRPSMLQTEGNLLDPETLQYEVKVSYLDRNNYRDKYYYIQFNDITELQKILETEREVEFKTKILHSFSHELKTPINISRNMIDLMIMDEGMPQLLKDKYAAVVRESVNQLDFLIQDILDFLKIESFQFQLEISKFCLKELLQEVVDTIQKRVEEHEIQIFLTSEQAEDYTVSTDRSRLKRVLLNVLSYVAATNNNCSLEFSVKTNCWGGCNFLLAMTNRVKESQSSDMNIPKIPANKTLFVQPDNDFGTVISKILLSKLKGNGLDSYSFDYDRVSGCLLRFSSTPFSEGSPLHLNYEPSFGKIGKNISSSREGDAVPPRKEKKSLTNLSNKKSLDFLSKNLDIPNSIDQVQETQKPCPRVLVVDDDYFNLISINMLLEKLNLFSIKASNGVEAITNLTKYQKEHICLNEECKGIELVIMDLMMPVMNGLDCTEELLKMMKEGEIPEIPVIACTANDSKDVIERCEQIGFKEVLSKPISLEILTKSVYPMLSS